MSKSPEELKAALVKRAQERSEMEGELVLEDPVNEEDFIEISEEAEVDLMQMMNESEVNHTLMVVEEEGFNSYVTGLEVEQNPYVTEDEELLSEAWVDGWYSAHVQACVANIMLNAKALVEADDSSKAEAALNALTEAVQMAEEAVDFNETQEFWDSLMEGADPEEEPNDRG